METESTVSATISTGPALYVGTYHKYNSGSIEGAWLYLENYSDKDEFLAACAELHKDESDPEFMFQDFMNFPKSFYSEDCVKEELFEWLALDEDDRELLDVYQNIRIDAVPSEIDDIKDKFRGKYSSLEGYVIEFWEECGEYKQDDKNWRSPINYVDWERMARDLKMSGDIDTAEHGGEVYVFSSF